MPTYRPHPRGKLCSGAAQCALHQTIAGDARSCPSSLAAMWRSAPGFGHGTNMAMRCDLDGSWTPAGAEVFLPLQPNPFFNYSSSLHVSQETCRQMPWTKKGVMSQAMRQRRIA